MHTSKTSSEARRSAISISEYSCVPHEVTRGSAFHNKGNIVQQRCRGIQKTGRAGRIFHSQWQFIGLVTCRNSGQAESWKHSAPRIHYYCCWWVRAYVFVSDDKWYSTSRGICDSEKRHDTRVQSKRQSCTGVRVQWVGEGTCAVRLTAGQLDGAVKVVAYRFFIQIARIETYMPYRACDVASKQSRLKPGRLCSVRSPAAVSVLRWLFETVEQLNQAIVDEWYAVRAVSEVHWSQYQWMATTSGMCHPAEWQTYWTSFK